MSGVRTKTMISLSGHFVIVNEMASLTNTYTIMIFTGEESRRLVHKILASHDDNDRYPLMEGHCGYFRNADGSYSAWDNTTGDCWCEDFKNKKQCLEWLQQ